MQDEQQARQEDEYSFPYHYIADDSSGFIQCRNDAWGINYLATIDYLISRLHQESFESLIDLGCGDGRFTRDVTREFPGKRVVGIDVSRRAISLANAMAPGTEFRCVDLIRDPIPDSFDLAVLMEVYEHIDPVAGPAFLRAIARLLGDDGVLYVTVPHLNKPLEYKHYRHFSLRSLMAELSEDFEHTGTVFIEPQSLLKHAIDFVFTNYLFVLNNRRLGGLLYRIYRRWLFVSPTEKRCRRLIVRLEKR